MRIGGVRRLTLAPDPASARCYGLNFATGLETENAPTVAPAHPPGANAAGSGCTHAGAAVSPAEDMRLEVT